MIYIVIIALILFVAGIFGVIDDANDGSKCCCKTHPGKCQYCHDKVKDYES